MMALAPPYMSSELVVLLLLEIGLAQTAYEPRIINWSISGVLCVPSLVLLLFQRKESPLG